MLYIVIPHYAVNITPYLTSKRPDHQTMMRADYVIQLLPKLKFLKNRSTGNETINIGSP